jgi:hypothetical protein
MTMTNSLPIALSAAFITGAVTVVFVIISFPPDGEFSVDFWVFIPIWFEPEKLDSFPRFSVKR